MNHKKQHRFVYNIEPLYGDISARTLYMLIKPDEDDEMLWLAREEVDGYQASYPICEKKHVRLTYGVQLR